MVSFAVQPFGPRHNCLVIEAIISTLGGKTTKKNGVWRSNYAGSEAGSDIKSGRKDW
jgi:hypothetical protein